MDPEVGRLIEEAYRVFGRYSLGESVAVAEREGRIGPLEARLVVLTPIREIPAEIIARYIESQITGALGLSETAVKALLPRLFELIAGEDAGDAVTPLLTRLLSRSVGSRGWPAAETGLVDRFLAALFVLKRRAGGNPVTVLDLVAAAGADTAPLIEAWIADEGVQAVEARLSSSLPATGIPGRPWLAAAHARLVARGGAA